MRSLLLAITFTVFPALAFGADVRVSPGEDVQGALDQAMPGDVIILEQGTHSGPIETARDGEPGAPITLRGEGGATLTATERVVDVQHAYFRVEDVIIDAQFAESRVMRVDDGATGFELLRSTVRNARRHCVDIRNTDDVLIADSLIHHCLLWDGGREDAHGISAQSARRLVIRNTEIHTFTGDAFQIDPSRSDPGWTDVLVEGCTFWLAPVTDGAGGVPDGVVPGENAIDTKTLDDVTGRIVVRDTTAYGFRDGEISNMAAFNMKETIDASFERVTVYDSEIAFRLRGAGGGTPGATVSLANVLIFDTERALRLESELPSVIPVHHVTFGVGIDVHVDFESGGGEDIDVQNIVVVGPVPGELDGPTTFEATEADFEDIAAGNYIPVAGVTWLDAGVDLGFGEDRRGRARPQGAGPDPGAFEFGDAPAEDMGLEGSPDSGGSSDSPDSQPSDPVDGGGEMGADAGPGGSSEGGCSCSSAEPRGGGLVLLLGFWLIGPASRRRTRMK